MLVLSRHRDESIIIGNEIEVKVLSTGSGTVKIGIRAPQHVSVYRQEVFEQIRAQNLAAAQAKSRDLARLLTLLKTKKDRQPDE